MSRDIGIVRTCNVQVRTIASWGEGHPRLPQVLPSALASAGFEVMARIEHEVVNEIAEPGRSSHALLELTADFLSRRDLLPARDVAAWQDEQRRRSDDGRYSYRVMQGLRSIDDLEAQCPDEVGGNDYWAAK